MNNKSIAAVVIIILAAAGIFYFTRSKNAPSNENVKSSAEVNNATEAKTQGGGKSFKELLAAEQPQKCTVEMTRSEGVSSGILYIAAGKMRADFTAEAAGQTMKPHMISDGAYVYNWTEGVNTGMKFKVDTTVTGEAKQQGTVDLEQQVKYDCQKWTPDAAMFSPPASVTFTELMAGSAGISGQASSSVQNSNSAQCAACDQLPEGTKAQCKAALKCQ